MAEPSDAGPAPSGAPRPQLVINAQYVKDLSFENPRAPQSLLQQQGPPPEVQINVDVQAGTFTAEIYEVILTIRANAKQGADNFFVVELVYGAVVTLTNTPPEEIPPAILIEGPRLMWPFARAILAQVTSNGGFAPLLLNPIDFTDIYNRRKAAGQAPVLAPAPASPGPITV